MIKLRLNTSVEIKDNLQDVAAPALVRIPLEKPHRPLIKKKQTVRRGQVIAENSSQSPYDVGFVHASIDGVVEEVLAEFIVIGPTPTPKEGEQAPAPPGPEPCTHLDKLGKEELCRELLELGIDTSRFQAVSTLIINGLNPEPGVLVSEQLLKDAQDTLKSGLQILERAIKPDNIKMVVARGKHVSINGCTMVHAGDLYPATIDPLVVYAATGSEKPDNVLVISVADLFQIGRVAETGRPLMEAVVTVGQKVYLVPIGMQVKDLLEFAGVPYDSDWIIAINGPMRGEAIFDLSVGVPKSCTAITRQKKRVHTLPQPNRCISCHECVLVCPARIHPGMLSRYAEFNMFDKARSQHVDACLECGMCTFVCPAHRPVMQFLRLAKQQLRVQ